MTQIGYWPLFDHEWECRLPLKIGLGPLLGLVILITHNSPQVHKLGDAELSLYAWFDRLLPYNNLYLRT